MSLINWLKTSINILTQEKQPNLLKNTSKGLNITALQQEYNVTDHVDNIATVEETYQLSYQNVAIELLKFLGGLFLLLCIATCAFIPINHKRKKIKRRRQFSENIRMNVL